ncbi:MAG: hypothetical protein ACLFQV_05580 [Vulcanimicrobiota bacterium]
MLTKKRNKLILGVFTLWPVIYLFLFIMITIITMIFTANAGLQNQSWLVLLVAAFHLITIGIIFILMGIYVYLIVKNKNIRDEKKIIWLAVILFGSIIAMPVYWYAYIWNPKQDKMKEEKDIF